MRIAGRLMLIKIGDGASPESFTTVACQRGTSNSLQSESIDVSDKDTRWRQMVAGGSKGVSLSASGLIANAAAHRLLTNLSTQNAAYNFQIVFADGQTISGSFRVETWALSGEFNDAQQYELTLVSADDMTYSDSAPPVLTLIDTQYVNISALDFGVSDSSPSQAPAGTTVAFNVPADDVLVIRKPALAADANMTWDAWSNTSGTWLNTLRVSDQDDATLIAYNSGGFGTAGEALTAAQGDFPQQLTGSTRYVFWARDTVVDDNAGGLSFQIDRYRYI